jgi:hypothetical protein
LVFDFEVKGPSAGYKSTGVFQLTLIFVVEGLIVHICARYTTIIKKIAVIFYLTVPTVRISGVCVVSVILLQQTCIIIMITSCMIFAVLQQLSVDDTVLMACDIWSIWKQMNNWIWNNVTDAHNFVVFRAIDVLNDW